MHDHVIRELADAVTADAAPEDSALAELVEGVAAEDVVAALRAALPLARERHQRVGLSDAMSDETLADLERKHALYGADSVVAWLVGILRGDFVQVGRLQVERERAERGHALHIPETGSLAPESVSNALERARSLTGSSRFTCTSWLLDRQLTAALPHTNVASFARRFEIVEEDEGDDGDEAVAKFVFRQTPAQVLSGSVTPRTRLERFVVERLRSGPRWTQPVGVLDLDVNAASDAAVDSPTPGGLANRDRSIRRNIVSDTRAHGTVLVSGQMPSAQPSSPAVTLARSATTSLS